MRARRASSADLDFVLSLEGRYATTAHWTRHQFEEELSARNSVFIVCESGFAVARLYRPNLEILDIAVAEQRKGVGRFLIEALRAEAAGCDTITLEVSSNNSGGVAFYEAMGFRTVGKRARFYADGSDAVLMDLEL